MSALTAMAIVLGCVAVLARSWVAAALVVAPLALYLWQHAYFSRFIARASLEDLDEVTGWEFERWLERFFTRVGYEVERTPYRGDFGADLVLTWNGMRIAVQAKRSVRAIGIRAVQEVVAAKAYYGCDQAMVVTSSYFTDEAIVLGRANGVLMRSRDDLARKTAELGGARAVGAVPSLTRQLPS